MGNSHSTPDPVRVSVVIPAYNAERFVKDAVESVLAQTAVDRVAEILVIDDGSSDGTSSAAASVSAPAGCELRVVWQDNAGPSAARNKGLDLATSRWVAFLDVDDTWLPTKLEKQLAVIDRHPDVRFLGSNRVGQRSHWGRRIEPGLRLLTARHLLLKYHPQASTWLLDNELLGDVRFPLDMRHAEDGRFTLTITGRTPLYYLEEELAVPCPKHYFGEAGLSGDIVKMHQGCMSNVAFCRTRGMINPAEAAVFAAWERAKYWRRKLVVRRRRAAA